MFYLDQNFIDGYLYLGFIDRKFIICDDPTSEMYAKEYDREAAFIILETLCLKLLNVSVKKSKMHHVIKINKARVKECPDVCIFDVIERKFIPRLKVRYKHRWEGEKVDKFRECLGKRPVVMDYYMGKLTMMSYCFFATQI